MHRSKFLLRFAQCAASPPEKRKAGIELAMAGALRRFLVVIFAIITPFVDAQALVNPLQHYIQKRDPIKNSMHLVQLTQDSQHQVSRYQYAFTSQHWPLSAWQHTLVIYRPQFVKHDTALLFINGGTRNPLPGQAKDKNPPPATLDFARIAHESNSIVIDLQDIPNQYLVFADGVPRKEDSIVAYTWRKYLQNPDKNAEASLYLPMTKAVVKSMDGIQNYALSKWKIKIKHFVLSGVSKRGWTTWLSALSDRRVSAIAPVVIDILNTKENILLTYERYGCQFPPAYHDYLQEGVIGQRETPEFNRLMQFTDPLEFLKGPERAKYSARLSIPKYIITASGDDFFLPDGSSLYLDKLPGETRLNVVPNQSHYIDMQIVGDTLLSWYQQILSGQPRPQIAWRNQLNSRQVITKTKPQAIRLWRAFSNNCDFRKNAGIQYQSETLVGQCTKKLCVYPLLDQAKADKGCIATFVEAEYVNNEMKTTMHVTTPVIVDEAQTRVSACSTTPFSAKKLAAH